MKHRPMTCNLGLGGSFHYGINNFHTGIFWISEVQGPDVMLHLRTDGLILIKCSPPPSISSGNPDLEDRLNMVTDPVPYPGGHIERCNC